MFDQNIDNPVHRAQDQSQDKFAPEEFRRLADVPESITVRGARLFKTDIDNFINWRWHMRHQVSSIEQAMKFMDLDVAEQEGFRELDQIFNAGVTPYYMALARPHEPGKPCPIRLQALPRSDELSDRYGLADPLKEKEHSPVREVVHLYPDRVAFCVAMLCPV